MESFKVLTNFDDGGGKVLEHETVLLRFACFWVGAVTNCLHFSNSNCNVKGSISFLVRLFYVSYVTGKTDRFRSNFERLPLSEFNNPNSPTKILSTTFDTYEVNRMRSTK